MEQDIIITPEIEEQNIDIIAEQGTFPTGTIDITSNGITDVSSYANANVNVSVDLQNKEVNINENGTTTITADSGYNGLNEVEVNVNVPPSKYAPQYLRFQNFNGTSLQNEINNLDTSNMTTFESLFAYCSNLESLDMSGFNTENVTSLYYTFRNCSNLKNLNFSSYNIDKVFTANGMFTLSFSNSNNLVDLDLSSFVGKALTNVSTMFANCTYLRSVNLSNLTMRTGYYSLNFGAMFRNCTHLETIDISSIDFGTSTAYSEMFANCGTQTTTGLTKVYVKDATAQQWILNLPTSARPSTWTTDNVVIKN